MTPAMPLHSRTRDASRADERTIAGDLDTHTTTNGFVAQGLPSTTPRHKYTAGEVTVAAMGYLSFPLFCHTRWWRSATRFLGSYKRREERRSSPHIAPREPDPGSRAGKDEDSVGTNPAEFARFCYVRRHDGDETGTGDPCVSQNGECARAAAHTLAGDSHERVRESEAEGRARDVSATRKWVGLVRRSFNGDVGQFVAFGPSEVLFSSIFYCLPFSILVFSFFIQFESKL